MDKTKATVTMPLTEYEKLDRYKDAYNKLIRQIKNAAYIELVNCDGCEIVVDKQKICKIIVEYAPEDFDIDCFEDDEIKFTWIGETGISITKPDMLELLNGLHYAATSAKEGRISRESLDDQFNLIKDAVSKWEDGEKERPLTG